jgi:hypothetical protein
MNTSLSILNPALKPLSILVGQWKTAGSHPLMPGEELHGHATFEWIEGGAYLRMFAKIDHPKFPAGIAIFGTDNESGEITMLYFDDRKISRKYNFSIGGNQWKWWRNDSKFSQRFTVTISDLGNTMVSKGEMRRDGGDWEGDLSLTYTRVA